LTAELGLTFHVGSQTTTPDAFVTALGDFVASILLYTYETRPIAIEILSSLRQSDVGVAAAYGVVLMAVSAAVFALGADRGSGG